MTTARFHRLPDPSGRTESWRREPGRTLFKRYPGVFLVRFDPSARSGGVVQICRIFGRTFLQRGIGEKPSASGSP